VTRKGCEGINIVFGTSSKP